MEVFIKYFILFVIMFNLIHLSTIGKETNKLIQENTEELKKVNLGFEAINKPLGKAINMEYKK